MPARTGATLTSLFSDDWPEVPAWKEPGMTNTCTCCGTPISSGEVCADCNRGPQNNS